METFVYLMVIWNILQPFGNLMAIWYILYLASRKIWQPWDRLQENVFKAKKGIFSKKET
jgi:hypothetical protein